MYALVYWQILEMCELEKPAKTTHHCCSELVDRDLEVGQNVFLFFLFYGGAQVIPTAQR